VASEGGQVSIGQRVVILTLTVVSTTALVLGVVHVSVACQSLPNALGGVPGDSHPRTVLGLVLIITAVVVGAGTTSY